MSPSEIETELLDIIEKNPGITLNQMYYTYFEEKLNKKFPPMRAVVDALRNAGKIKTNDKKKNIGHFLASVQIDNEAPAVDKPSLKRAPSATGEDPTGDKKGSTATFNSRHSRTAVAKLGKFVLEKNEGHGWKMIDTGDIDTPIRNLYKQVIRMIPTKLRVRNTETEEILDERSETATYEELTQAANAA